MRIDGGKGGILKLLIIIFMVLICPVDKALAFNSYAEYEKDSGDSWCFNDDKVMLPWEIFEFNNTYIPAILGKDTRDSNGSSSAFGNTLVAMAARITAMYTVLYSSMGLASIWMGVEILVMLEVCNNTYIMQPHEFINKENGWWDYEKNKESGKYENEHKLALTSNDVPFYYSCDPKWDPVSGSQIDPKGPDAGLVGRVWGYMGAASPYCVGDAAGYARKERVGKVRVMYDGVYNDDDAFIGAGGTHTGLVTLPYLGIPIPVPMHYYAYYSFDSANAKIKICAVTPYTLLPLKIGCSQVAPPAEEYALDPFLELYTQGTRCYYLITGRDDLWSLGKALDQTDSRGRDAAAIKGFLQSDLHITSTVVGCIKDLLIKVFLSPTASPGYLNQGFFLVVQDRMRQIVFAVLVLYVSLLGIKIMTSPQVPNQGEFIMFIVRLGLVLYFTTAGAWYYVVNGEAKGLFPTLVWASDEIAGFFLSAQNDNDPIGQCKYWFQGQELLGQREIDPSSISGAKPTIGFQVLKMTVWDLVDCKVVNYANFGSCHYSLAGLIGAWLISAALLVTGNGILLAIVGLIYIIMLLLIIFRFTHIFVLSVFMVAILVLTSPIFLCFSLFEVTKGIFQSWMKMILGYILYPALLFAFIALMLVTFDSIYYGELIEVKTEMNTISPETDCKGIKSIYCTTVKVLDKNPCLVNVGKIGDSLTETLDLGPLGEYTRLKSHVADDYLDVVVKLMLFAILFYFFIGSVTNFLAVLTGVQDLGALAKGSIDIGAALKKVGGLLTGGAVSQASKIAGKITGGGKR